MPSVLHQQCLDAAQAILQGLALTGIGSNVVQQLEDDESNIGSPCIRLSAEGEVETLKLLTSASRLFGYPVKVDFLDRIAAPGGEALPSWTDQREKVMDAFPDHRAPGYPPGVLGCEVMPGSVVEGGRGDQRVLGSLTLRFKAVRQVAF